VGFHAIPADAERSGFRPCKRCRPNAAAPDLPAPRAASGPSIAARVASLDWQRIGGELDAHGCAATDRNRHRQSGDGYHQIPDSHLDLLAR